MSKVLRDAEKYEEIMDSLIPETKRPEFHLTARVGWMNDPNGFSYNDGQFHLFFQYYPYANTWGPMHWGHAISSDLLRWRYLPVAIAPDSNADRDGCFSGSALWLPDGRHMLMYTGVRNEYLPSGKILGVQTQCLAFGDGENYEKYPANPVLDCADIPEIYCRYDFRDPKIWRTSDGSFRSLISAATTAEKDGHLLLFSSGDGLNWKFEKTLIRNDGRFGRMWECPDLFELDNTHVLIVSPQDMLPADETYQCGNGTVCFIGEYDEKTQTFREKSVQPIDQGIDFYAPQTVLTPDGRRVMIGWMQNWDTINTHTPESRWFGQMSFPRELSVQDGRVVQKPIREIATLRRDPIRRNDVTVKGDLEIDGIRGRRAELLIEIEPLDPDRLYNEFAVFFAMNERFRSSVSFNPKTSLITIDRTDSGTRRAFVHRRSARIRRQNGKISLRLILDRFSAEVFVNGGEQALSMTIFTDQSADGIAFRCESGARMNVTKYELLRDG